MTNEEILEWLMLHGRDWVLVIPLIKWLRTIKQYDMGIVKAVKYLEEHYMNGYLEASKHAGQHKMYRLSNKAMQQLKERGHGISY